MYLMEQAKKLFCIDALLSYGQEEVQQQQQQAQSTNSRGKMFRSSKEARTFK